MRKQQILGKNRRDCKIVRDWHTWMKEQGWKKKKKNDSLGLKKVRGMWTRELERKATEQKEIKEGKCEGEKERNEMRERYDEEKVRK